MRLKKSFNKLVCVCAALLLCAPVWAKPVQVVVSIGPLHALAAGVMQGVAEPTLLIPPGASPHHYAMRPSQVKALNEADLIIWVGEPMETFLSRALAQLPDRVSQLALLNTADLDLLAPRSARDWHAPQAANTDDLTRVDAHIWLDPMRAQVMVDAMAQALAAVDPDNQARYERNAQAVNAKLATLNEMIRAELAPVKAQPFIVFHDAYQYFEQRYDLNTVGAITVNPEVMPSAQRVHALQKTIEDAGAVCIFAEPQFRPAIVDTLAQASDVHAGVIDPLGEHSAQFDDYAELLLTMSSAIKTCLAQDL